MHSRDNRDITWTLNSTPQPLQPHDVSSQKYTGISTMWTDQEKSCHTVNKVPLTKSGLDCRLLLSPATTDYSRLLKIIKDPSCWFSQSAYTKCFRLQSFSTICIFGACNRLREKKSNFAGFSETDSRKNLSDSREFSELTSPKTNQ